MIWRPASIEDLYLTAFQKSVTVHIYHTANNPTYFTRRHHHTSTDSVEGIRGNTSASGDSPAEQERGNEVTLEGTNKEDGLDRVVHAEVQSTVDNYTKNRGAETTVKTEDTIGGKSLLVDIDQAVELTVSSSLSVLGIVGKTSTSIIQRVHEKQGRSTSGLV